VALAVMGDLGEPYGVDERTTSAEYRVQKAELRLAGGNPVAGGVLRLSWRVPVQESELRLRVTDVCGRLVLTERLAGAEGSVAIPLRSLRSGVYFAAIPADAIRSWVRFVLP
jgi:hypothetical protein